MRYSRWGIFSRSGRATRHFPYPPYSFPPFPPIASTSKERAPAARQSDEIKSYYSRTVEEAMVRRESNSGRTHAGEHAQGAAGTRHLGATK